MLSGGVIQFLILIGLIVAYFWSDKTQDARRNTSESAPHVTVIPADAEQQDWLDTKAEQYLDERYADAEEDYREDAATEQAEYALEEAAQDERREKLLEDLANSCPSTNRDSNLRAGPGTNYPVIGFAPKDSCIPVDGSNNNGTWLVFHDDKEFGAGVDVWIAASLVENVPQDLSPVTGQAIPTPTGSIVTTPKQGCPPGGCTSYPDWCAPPIKGNISQNTGEKIYHVPGQEYYDATRISPDAGERWFCTEDEANAAGWRRSKR